MIILGIDPGSRITGYGIVQKLKGQVSHLENGAIHCDKVPEFHQRLAILFNRVQALIDQFQPEVIAIENIFYAKNVQSTLKLGHARGAILTAASLKGLAVSEYSPLEVKQSVAGYGIATKDQVQKMVRALLRLPEVAEENASDALAVALCHAHTAHMRKVMSIAG